MTRPVPPHLTPWQPKPTHPHDRAAWKLGRIAGATGHERSACPYPEGRRAEAWRSGWASGATAKAKAAKKANRRAA